MVNSILKLIKFVSSRRFVYLIIGIFFGIFLAVSITYVYAAWNDAKTGGSGQLSQTNWNTLVNEIHNKCGSNCDSAATAATASSNTLTENNWNNLVDLASNTLIDCTDNNGGKCFINQTSKNALDTDLAAGNIKSGVNVFGVAGTFAGYDDFEINKDLASCGTGCSGTFSVDCNCSIGYEFIACGMGDDSSSKNAIRASWYDFKEGTSFSNDCTKSKTGTYIYLACISICGKQP